MRKKDDIYLAIERTKEMYDKKKTKTAIYTIIVLAAILYFCWLREFNSTLDYLIGIVASLFGGAFIYYLALLIVTPALIINEHEKEVINMLKRELDRLEDESLN